ncbi:solute carrier family 2, facilitated glucose transporter member 5-like [Elgaria multicarinata webbii]|uniref:solute carrier family 2, facilitated glucose transporter member 5-like n=1 Tax=Elgaria multicarinata webbii TaxID=159646 RepID=UPI002FCD4AA1
MTSGGRVLTVTAVKKDLVSALEEANKGVGVIRCARQGLSRTHVWVSVASATFSIQYGYNIYVVYFPTVLLEHFYNITTFEQLTEPSSQLILIGITIALFPFGGIFGALMVGYLMDTFGRKGTLMITSVSSSLSAILMSCSNLIHAFGYTMFARFYTGICAGILSSVIPLYLGEIAPRSLRGAFIMMPHLFTTIGVLLSRIMAYHHVLGNQKGWPLLLGIIGVIPVIQMFLVPFYPESPGYLLIQKRNEEKARQALQKLRDKEDVEDEMEELRQEDIAEKSEKDMTPFKVLRTESLRWQVITVIVMMSGQQLAGLNAAYYYTEKIYMATNVGIENVPYISTATTALLCISSALAMYLADSAGRRVLILIGFVGCTITCVLLTMTLELQESFTVMKYFSAFFVNTFLFGHFLGPGPVPFVLVVELFYQSSRASAYVIAGFLKWFLTFVTGVSFLQIQNRIGSYSFFIFWPICIATFYFIFRYVPETKQKTYMDIRRIIAIQATRRIEVKERRRK